MTSFENTLWHRLVDEEAADELVRPNEESGRRLSRVAVSTGVVGGIAAAAAGTVLLVSGAASTPPAYAFVPHGDGTYTLTINDIATAIPQVNAEFAKLGIRDQAIPVTPTCTASSDGIPLNGPDAAASMSESVTIGNAYIPAGSTGWVAAEQTPAGVRISMGTTTGPIPPCFNSNQAAPILQPTGTSATDTATN